MIRACLIDKMKKTKKKIRVGFDVDGVLANFALGVIRRAEAVGLGDHFPDCYTKVSSWGMSDKLTEVMHDAWVDPGFWLALEPMMGTLPDWIEVDCYVTSRPIQSEITREWLLTHGFPDAEVITVPHAKEKLQHVLDRKPQVFVDDLFHTVREMRDSGVNALLWNAPYQVGHEEECEGLPRISKLEEIKDYVK